MHVDSIVLTSNIIFQAFLFSPPLQLPFAALFLHPSLKSLSSSTCVHGQEQRNSTNSAMSPLFSLFCASKFVFSLSRISGLARSSILFSLLGCLAFAARRSDPLLLQCYHHTLFTSHCRCKNAILSMSLTSRHFHLQRNGPDNKKRETEPRRPKYLPKQTQPTAFTSGYRRAIFFSILLLDNIIVISCYIPSCWER